MFYVYWIYYWEVEDIYSSGYVGITNNIRNRFIRHRKKFGNFKFKIIFTGTLAQVYALELALRPNPNIGLNKARGGLQFGTYGPRLGLTTSDEVKEKLRQSNLGLKRTDETRERLRQVRINISEETRQRMRDASKGRKLSDASRAKVSEALRGRVRTEESREKTRKTMTGVKYSEERKANMRKPKKLRIMNLCLSNHHSIETIAFVDAEAPILKV